MDAVAKIYDCYERYAGEKFVYGRSVSGKPLVGFFVGKKQYPVLLVQYAVHAREWITALLALEHLVRGVPHGGAYILPLTNPDGAALCLRGEGFLRKMPPGQAEFLRRLNGGSGDFSLWKANARGVDLNVNFDAEWGSGAANVFAPAPENYVGPAPFSEPETRALRDFTKKAAPDATLSFHTKGGEIYWEFGQRGVSRVRDERTAKVLAQKAGYTAKQIAGSAGGYKDWCIKEFGIPSFTVEAGSDALPHPLGEACLPDLVRECGGLVGTLSEILNHGR